MGPPEFLRVMSFILDGLVAISTLVGVAIKTAAGITFTVLVTKLANKWFDNDDDKPKDHP